MIHISMLPTGSLIIQQDANDILLDQAAIAGTLGPILLILLDHTRALGEARRQGHEDGLTIGHARGVAETEARYRREAEQFAEGLSLLKVPAPMAA